MEWLTNWFFDLLYGIQKTICYIIDFIKNTFYILVGIEPVNIDGTSSDLLTNFLLDDTVKKVFFAVVLIGIILLVVFVLVAIIRSEYTKNEGNGIQNKTKILSKAMQSFLIFLIIPFILIAGISLSNIVVCSINSAMNPSTLATGMTTTFGGQILVTSGHYAYIGDESIREEIEMMFATGQLDYFNIDVVKQYYNLRSVNFFIGIVGSIVILVMFVMSSVMFIQRIFDVVFLYIISPISVSTIPVDDGNRFRMWKDMMITKVLSAYGIILSMNLFFIIIPQIQDITFFNDSFKDGIVKLLFFIGGSYAVTKANIVVASLIGDRSSQNETRQLFANIRTGGHIMKSTALVSATAVGSVLGGKTFLKTKKQTGSRTEGYKASFKKQDELIQRKSATRNKKDYMKLPTRLASMPIGMLKDLASGGLVSVGKNFIPRCRNVVQGETIISRPQAKQVKPEKKKNNEKEEMRY